MTQNLLLLDETRAWLVRAAEDLAAAIALIARNWMPRWMPRLPLPLPLPLRGRTA
jgi:hypothetical protein